MQAIPTRTEVTMNAFFRVLTVFALGVGLATAWPGLSALARDGGASPAATATAPDFTGIDHWFNSPPLHMQDLRGKVVLVEFWTNECINCVHVLPHTKELYDKYAKDGLVVVGVHTPEYDEERDPATVKAAINRFGIDWPVAIDNQNATWNAWNNQFWPALYLVDPQGHVVYQHFGEGNYDTTEAKVRQLLGKG
jgi:thiol-disulfide isomerase/thioredoxin